jgi:uncharacterized protein (TIGR03067 family)
LATAVIRPNQGERRSDDQRRLQGVWDYVSVTYEGKPFDVGKRATITISGRQWTIRRNGMTIQSTAKVDPTKTPKRLDSIIRRQNVAFSLKSIYRFDGNRLILCEPDHPNGPRPTRFSAKQGDRQFLIILQRRGKKTSEDKDESD